MKRIHFWLLALICMAVSYCTKSDPALQKTLSPFYVDSAVERLRDLLPLDHFQKLNIASPDPIQWEGNLVALRFYEEGSGKKKFVLLRKTNGEFNGTSVDLTGLQASGQKRISGSATVMDLVTKSVQKFQIQDNQLTGIQGSPDDLSSSLRKEPSDHQTSLSSPDNPQNLDDFVVWGSTYTSPFYSLYWLFGQSPPFTHYYTTYDLYSSGSYASNVSSAVVIPVVDSPDHPIDIDEEVKCFTVDSKASYTIGINVNQPSPKSRTIVALQTQHQVGHTYYTLQENLTDGSSIIRNVGFYPKHKAKVGKEIDQSSFGDDSYTPYTVSLKISLSSSEFFSLLQKVASQQNNLYDLDSYNCTSSVIDALNSINIHLPATVGSNGVFCGNNPADLGEDIRQMDLKAFSSNNQGRKIIRNTSNKNDYIPPEARGYCK